MVDLVNIGMAVDSRQVREGRKALGDFGDQAGKTEKATSKMSGALKGALVAAMAAATAAVWKSIEAHREFSKSISELSAITGATGQDLKFYRQEAMALGSTTTFAASEVAEAFKLVASAKPDLLESKEALAEVTREVLTLAEASGMAMPEASKALGGALNQFGAGAESANRYINVLAAGAKYGASEINDTSQALKNSGAVASSVGLSFEETNAAIQALAANSIKGAEAGTGLRSVLLKLADQANSEFNPEIVGLEQALKNLEDANLSTTEKMDLFGQESITAATALMEQSDQVGELTDKLTGTQTAYDQARTNTNNLDGDIKEMGSSWEGAALILGDTFDPALRGTVQLLRDIGKVASSLIIAFADMGDALGAYAAVAASVASFEFDQAGAILEARKKAREENEKRLDQIWEEKDAIEEKAEAERKAAEAQAAAEEEAKAQAEARAKARAESEKKAAEKAAEIRAEARAKEEERAAEAAAKKEESDQARREKELEDLRQHYMTEQELARVAYEERQAMIAELEEEGDISKEEARQLEFEAQWEHELRMMDIEEEGAKARTALKEREMAAKKEAERTFWGDVIGLMSSGSKKLFEIGKVAAIANAVVDGTKAAISAWKAGMSTGGPWAPAVAAAYTAASLAKTGSMIQSLKSASFNGGGGVSVSGGGGVSTGADFNGGAGDAGQPATQTGTTEEQSQITFIVEGNVMGNEDFENSVVKAIEDAQTKDRV